MKVSFRCSMDPVIVWYRFSKIVCVIVWVRVIVWYRYSIIVCYYVGGEPGKFVGKSAGLVIERLRVRSPAGAAGEFSSPELTLCADSYPVSVPLPCYRSGT